MSSATVRGMERLQRDLETAVGHLGRPGNRHHLYSAGWLLLSTLSPRRRLLSDRDRHTDTQRHTETLQLSASLASMATAEQTMTSTEDLVELLVDGARYGDMEDVQQALQAGVDVNAKDGSSRTALHMAAANGHCDIAEALIAARADPDSTNSEGSTPLHWACLNGHKEVVDALMKAGANPSKLNSQQRTPVDEALTRGFEEVMEVIRGATAQKTMGEDGVEDVDPIAMGEAP